MYHDIKLKSEKIKSDYDVTLDDFKLHLNIASNYEDPPKFTFDDGKKSSLIAADLLNLKNMKGIFFVITGLIGRKDYLNKREINYLSDKGHIIGSHSHSHSSFDVLSDKKAEEELIKSKKILEEITGSKIFDFAFPGGKKKNHHTSLAKKIGYKNIYTSYESYNKTNAGCFPAPRAGAFWRMPRND